MANVATNPSTVNIEGLSVAFENDVPRVRDVDLAERLGYAQSRDIRKLIKKLAECGDLSEVAMRATVTRIEKTGAIRGVEERTVDEYWLTEEEALFVAARSETKVAATILKGIIRVFVLARRGILQPVGKPPVGWQLDIALDLMGPGLHPAVVRALEAQRAECEGFNVFDWVSIAKKHVDGINAGKRLAETFQSPAGEVARVS